MQQEALLQPCTTQIDSEADNSHTDGWLRAARRIWEKRELLIVIVLVGTTLSLLIALLIPNSYEAKTELMPPELPSDMTFNMLVELGTSGTGLLGVPSSVGLLVSILDSETVHNQIINRFDLRRVYGLKTFAAAKEELSRRTSVHADRRSGVITLVFLDRDPARGSAVAGAYVEELNRTLANLNAAAARRERVFLEERIKLVRQELDQSAKDLSEFASKNVAVDIEQQMRTTLKTAAVLQEKVVGIRLDLRGLEQIYTSNNVRVVRIQAELAELRRRLEQMGGASVTSSDAGFRGRPFPTIHQLPWLGVSYAELFRRVKTNESILEVLTREYELAKIQEAKEIPSAKIIDDATFPEHRSGPPRMLITLTGALLSLFLGALWLCGRERWVNTDPEDPRRHLVTEMVGVVTYALYRKRIRMALKVAPARLWYRLNRNHDSSE
jgi:uncharacterized protein involved in exopolysaccharide biosynthesis